MEDFWLILAFQRSEDETESRNTEAVGGEGHQGHPPEHCQINFKAPALDEEGAQLCSTELAPLGKSGGTVQLEIFAAVEMTLLIEMIVYG